MSNVSYITNVEHGIFRHDDIISPEFEAAPQTHPGANLPGNSCPSPLVVRRFVVHCCRHSHSLAMSENKRTAAYENIFGRPSAQHHRPSTTVPLQQPYYQQPYRGPPNGQHYQQYSQQYSHQYYHPQQQQQQQQQDPRRSYTSSVSSHQSAYSHHYSSSQTYTTPAAGAPYRPSLEPTREHQLSVAPSLLSSPGIIAPVPDPPVDPGLEHYTRQGLTPAQAYQAQVYQNVPVQQQQQNWAPYRPVSSPQHPVISANPPPSQQPYHPEPESASVSHSHSLDIEDTNDSSQEGMDPYSLF